MKIVKGEGDVVAWVGCQDGDELLLYHILESVEPRTDRDVESLEAAKVLATMWYAQRKGEYQ